MPTLRRAIPWLLGPALALIGLGVSASFSRGAGPKRPRRPKLFVLSIGVNVCRGQVKLNFAAADARAVARVFRTKSRPLFARVGTRVLTNRQANRRGVLRGLRWLRRQTTARDVAVIFYSGHGGNERPVGFYLLPSGFHPGRWTRTMVSGRDLRRAVRRIPGRVVLLLDCCYSGAILKGLRPRKGLRVICAARPRQRAKESKKSRHGYLTRALVEGLSGKADANRDGVVHVSELQRYTRKRVRQLSRNRQHPVTFQARKARSFPLAKSREKIPPRKMRRARRRNTKRRFPRAGG
jgi:uncharacterized caspase-like protein